MTSLDKQIGGNHYKDFEIQPIEFIHKNNLGFEIGNVIKYVCRYKLKGEIQDLEKAKHYIELLIELSTNKSEKIENSLIICLKCSSNKENCKCKNLEKFDTENIKCKKCNHENYGNSNYVWMRICKCECHYENKFNKSEEFEKRNLKTMAKNFSINLIKKDGFYLCYDCNNSHSPFDIKNCECNCHKEYKE